MTEEEQERLRRHVAGHVAGHVIGDSPPPLPAAAQDLIRAMLGTQKVSRDTFSSTPDRE